MNPLEVSQRRPISLVGWGACRGPLEYSNADLTRALGFSPDLATDVAARIGTERRGSATDIAARRQVVAQSDMAFAASTRALAQANVAPGAVDAIIGVATILDHFCPSIAVRTLKLLGGRERALTFDLIGGCGTYASALFLAIHLLEMGTAETALIVAAEPLTRLLWMVRRKFEALLFGDGAGALIVSTCHSGPWIIRRCVLNTVANLGGCRDEIMTVPVVGSGALPPVLAASTPVDPGMPEFGYPDDFRATHHAKLAAKWGAHYLAAAIESVSVGIPRRDLFVVPHQPSKVVLEAVRAQLGLETAQVASINETHGNLSSASVPTAFAERHAEASRFPWTVLAPVGTGLTVGAVLMERC